jgi:hypothetical protein
MPTVLRSGPYHFYFIATSPTNRLTFISIAGTYRRSSGLILSNWSEIFGFRAHELRALQSIVTEHREDFREAWDEFFGIHGR